MFGQVIGVGLRGATASLQGRYAIHARAMLLVWVAVLGGSSLCAGTAVKAIGLHPENPHYFLWRGNPKRAGKYAMKTSLDQRKDKVAYRTEVSGPGSEVGKEYWYGFSIFLPDDYVVDDVWEIVAQWHGVPDFKAGEDWRNPVMALSTDGGRWGLINRWDAKFNTFEGGKRKYGGTKRYDLGAYRRGVWTDWVVHVRWSYGPDGLLEVWKDGKKVVEQNGPNAFNDKKGPYFKMGLYKGWKDPKRSSDVVSRRVLYHDEFRMAGADGRYEDVAPNDKPR